MAGGGGNATAQERWHEARLIPAVGIRGQEEQEKRATSSLLAVVKAVPDFGHALIGQFGAPKGRLATYAEVQLKDSEGKTHIPDGAVVAERGKTRWRALVEVKTGSASLQVDQVNRYLDIARDHGFDAVITISNQLTGSPFDSPLRVDRRKLRGVNLYHLSWWRIITEAIVQHRFRGVTDPDQAWVLGELIAYLDDERSGASGFEDMGENWVKVRTGAAEGTLRATNPDVQDVAERWDQFVAYLSLGLAQDLGRDVQRLLPRKETRAARIDRTGARLASEGVLDAALKVPDAVGPLSVEADLRTRRVTTSVTLDAPGLSRPLARMNWVLRQLKHAPDGLIIETSFVNTKTTTACALTEARENANCLLSADPKRLPRAFRLSLARPMGTKRGRGERSFVRETRQQAIDFYRELVQDLSAWQPPAPRLPKEPSHVEELPQPDPHRSVLTTSANRAQQHRRPLRRPETHPSVL
jgi:hypothetical protein